MGRNKEAYQPLDPEGDDSAEHKNYPEDWTHNQTQPEYP